MNEQIVERGMGIFADYALNFDLVAENPAYIIARTKRGQPFVCPKTGRIDHV